MSAQFSRADRIARGVLLHYADLPKLVGPEWPRLHWSLLDRLDEFHAATDEDSRERITLALLDLVLQRVPFSTESWLTVGLSDLDGEPSRGPVDHFQTSALTELLDRLLRPFRFHGEVELTHPQVIRIGSRALVSLAFLPAEAVEGVASALELKETIPVQVRAWGEGVFLSPGEQLIHLDRSSLPCQLTYQITGLTPGPGLLVIEIRQERRLLKVLHGHIHIEESPAVKGSRVSGRFPFEAGGRAAPRTDALIQFELSKSGRARFSLEFDNSRGLATRAEFRLKSNPRVYWRRLRAELERLPGGDPLGELERIGRRLYQEWWPAALIPAMEELLASDARTVQVCSSHPWLIPWELLRPYGLSGSSRVQERFLCERFDMALWHFSETAIRPSAELRLAHIACVFDRTVTDLPYLDHEREAIQRQAAQRGLRLSLISPADRGNVLRSLGERADAPVDVWHFGGHGDHAFDDPDAAPLFLESGTSIEPRDLAGAEWRLRAERPFVFLNACRVGHGGAGLTSTAGGWPGRLVGNCGVGAVLAPLWAIDDEAAAAFAQAFYERLPREGDPQQMTIAELVGSIRKAVRRPGDPTWLAYSLFADPNARITAGP
jgi:hypothetical protein